MKRWDLRCRKVHQHLKIKVIKGFNGLTGHVCICIVRQKLTRKSLHLLLSIVYFFSINFQIKIFWVLKMVILFPTKDRVLNIFIVGNFRCFHMPFQLRLIMMDQHFIFSDLFIKKIFVVAIKYWQSSTHLYGKLSWHTSSNDFIEAQFILDEFLGTTTTGDFLGTTTTDDFLGTTKTYLQRTHSLKLIAMNCNIPSEKSLICNYMNPITIKLFQGPAKDTEKESISPIENAPWN